MIFKFCPPNPMVVQQAGIAVVVEQADTGSFTHQDSPSVNTFASPLPFRFPSSCGINVCVEKARPPATVAIKLGMGHPIALQLQYYDTDSAESGILLPRRVMRPVLPF